MPACGSSPSTVAQGVASALRGHIRPRTPAPQPVPRGRQAPGTPWQLLDFPLDGSSQNQNPEFFCRFLVCYHTWRAVSCFILSLARKDILARSESRSRSLLSCTSVVLGLRKTQTQSPLYSMWLVAKLRYLWGWGDVVLVDGWTEPRWEDAGSCRKGRACRSSSASRGAWLPPAEFWSWQAQVKTWALWSDCPLVNCCWFSPALIGVHLFPPVVYASSFFKRKHNWNNIMLVSGKWCKDLIFVYIVKRTPQWAQLIFITMHGYKLFFLQSCSPRCFFF